jgi:Protein of unknown function (DUF3592)
VPPSPVVFLLRLVGLAVLAGGLYLTVTGLRRILVARQSRSWTRTQGCVVALECASSQTFDGSPAFETVDSVEKLAATQPSPHDDWRARYIPRVRYSYRTNDGAEREGSSIYIGGERVGHVPKVAATYLEPYRRGQQVTVYYQPNHPDFSVLEPGLRPRSAVVFIMGALLTFFGLVLTGLAWTALR